VPNFVECESGEGKSLAVAWQPLYLSSELGAGTGEETEGEANICYSLYDDTGDWQSDSNDKKRLEFGGQNVFRGTASEVGRIALATKVAPGKSVSSQKPLLLRVHDISDQDCSKVDASIKPPQIASGGDGVDDNKLCKVLNYDGAKYDKDPEKERYIWNSKGGLILTKDWRKNSREEVEDQNPEAGDDIDCSATITLDFD